MRFDEYLQARGIVASPVDQFDGFHLRLGGPPDWEPFDSAVGAGVWVCRSDPRINQFCANAVLTMHRIDATLDTDEVFAMLSNQQVQTVPGSQELSRGHAAASEGPGLAGSLVMQITSDLGVIDSVSSTRIITTEHETLIAQLTVTALHDSPVDRTHIWLKVVKSLDDSSSNSGRSVASDDGTATVTDGE